MIELETGDLLICDNNLLEIRFARRREIISTSALNGGIQTSLKGVFNCDCKEYLIKLGVENTISNEELLLQICHDHALDEDTYSGLCTCAYIKNTSVKTEIFQELSVTAVVTAGVDENGQRIGEHAEYYEQDGCFSKTTTGTVNIILLINASIPAGTLSRILITATEAKTAAIEELQIPSAFSNGIATGSGTDGIIVVSNPDSLLRCTEAGQHCKLGELIGRCVKEAVKEALFLQTQASGERQHHIFRRISRFGITEEAFWKQLAEKTDSLIEQKELFETFCTESEYVIQASLFAHLMDQLEWKLLTKAETFKALCRLGICHPKEKSVLDASGNHAGDYEEDYARDYVAEYATDFLRYLVDAYCMR